MLTPQLLKATGAKADLRSPDNDPRARRWRALDEGLDLVLHPEYFRAIRFADGSDALKAVMQQEGPIKHESDDALKVP